MIHLKHCWAKSNEESDFTFHPIWHNPIAWGTETSRNTARTERVAASSLQVQPSWSQGDGYYFCSVLCETKLMPSGAEHARKGETIH